MHILLRPLAILAAVAAAAGPGVKTYEYYVAGNTADVRTKTTSGLVLEGGGKDVDRAFRWLLEHAGGGDIVVLRAAGTDSYNAYIRKLGTSDSVETLVVGTPEGARDRFVRDRIRNAEGLFIAGGNQRDYFRWWKDSPLQGAIHHLVWRGVPIGGSSAGLAILGEYTFTAERDTITSKEALANPFDARVVIESGFLHLPYMRGVIADSHLFERDRMGRLVTFLARIRKSSKREARGIGLDEHTAVLVERDGVARVTGSGTAYFLRLSEPAQVCEPGRPLQVHGIEVYRVPASGTFNLRTWQSEAVSTYELSSEKGVLQSSTGSIY